MSSGGSALVAKWVEIVEAPLTNINAYTHVPQDTAGTYIVLSFSNLPDNTKTFNRVMLSVDIDIFSDYKGLKEVTDIGKLIYDSVQRTPFTVTGFSLGHPQFESDRYFDVPTEGARGVVTFSMLVRPE